MKDASCMVTKFQTHPTICKFARPPKLEARRCSRPHPPGASEKLKEHGTAQSFSPLHSSFLSWLLAPALRPASERPKLRFPPKKPAVLSHSMPFETPGTLTPQLAHQGRIGVLRRCALISGARDICAVCADLCTCPGTAHLYASRSDCRAEAASPRAANGCPTARRPARSLPLASASRSPSPSTASTMRA